MNQYGTGRGGSRPPGGERGDKQQKSHGVSGDQRDNKVADLWPDYLAGGYFDADGCLKVEYVSRNKVEPLAEAMCKCKNRLTSHQIRRYFGHCRRIEIRLKPVNGTDKEIRWRAVWPDVKKLEVAAADGIAKSPSKIPPLFHDFIRRNVATIETRKDFLEGFLPHFEALLGFAQTYFSTKERN